jgi:hypothetical protein
MPLVGLSLLALQSKVINVLTTRLNMKTLHSVTPHFIYVLHMILTVSNQITTISLYNIHPLVCVMDAHCVPCEVRTAFLCI